MFFCFGVCWFQIVGCFFGKQNGKDLTQRRPSLEASEFSSIAFAGHRLEERTWDPLAFRNSF